MKTKSVGAAVVAVILMFACAIFLFRPQISELTGEMGKADSGVQDIKPSSEPSKEGPLAVLKNSQGIKPDDGQLSFEEVKDLANRGDAFAQRKLGEIYENCLAYSLNPSTHLATLDNLAKLNPESKPNIELIKNRQVSQCQGIDGGMPIPLEAYKLWTEQAARSGDLASKLKLRARASSPASADEIDSLTNEVLASDDPQALFELARIMGKPHSDGISGQFGSISGNASAEYAWSIVACRAGVNCGSGSSIMDSICINTGSCNYSSYEAFVMSELVTLAERKRVNEMISQINKLRKR